MKQRTIETRKSQVKTIGAGGQIYLGKEFAGQHVLVTQTQQGVWQVKTADIIPHNERFWHQPVVAQEMETAFKDLQETPAQANTPEEIEAIFAKALSAAGTREQTNAKGRKK
jgi:putative transposon-encoded protein